MPAGRCVTGLANRNLLEQRRGELLPSLAPLALMIVDLVRFRDVNYALGHLVGDSLLVQAAQRLAALVGKAGLVARLDARFAVLLEGCDTEGARRWAASIHEALATPFAVAGISCEIGARIGIALAPAHGSGCHTLLRKADIALYQAARASRSSAVYDAFDDPHTPARLGLIGDFRAAVEQGQLRMYCQPKVDLRRGRIVGAEALARWHHPDKGVLAPESFVPLIESTELIHLLTRHMLAGAAAQCEAWRTTAPAPA